MDQQQDYQCSPGDDGPVAVSSWMPDSMVTPRQSINQRPESAPVQDSQSMQYLDHMTKLKAFCRACGRPNTRYANRKPTAVSALKTRLLRTFELDISNDDPAIHPPFICMICKAAMDKGWKKIMRKMVYKRIVPLPIFQSHSDQDCYICDFESSPSPGQTPAKTVMSLDLKKPQSSVGIIIIMPGQPATPAAGSISTSHANKSAEKSSGFCQKDAKCTPVVASISSIPIDRCVEKSLAESLRCSVCLCVPLEPTITECGHIHCRNCITEWFSFSKTCKLCMTIIRDLNDVACLSGFHESVYKVLHVSCEFNGCTEILLISNIAKHEETCKYGKYKPRLLKPKSSKLRGPSLQKQPLLEARRQHVKRQRLKKLITNINQFCDHHHESKRDVLFFLLRNELEREGNNKGAKAVEQMWTSSSAEVTLTPKAESLAPLQNAIKE